MSWLSGFEHFVRQSEPLAPHTWFRLGGPAEYFAEPTSVEELTALIARAKKEGVPVRLLGGGSNILVSDAGVSGLVISLAAPCFTQIETLGTRVRAGAGAKLGHVISTAVRQGLGGLEGLVGIPGTIGGALHGNAGSRSGDIGPRTSRAVVVSDSGQISERRREELQFSYRTSSLDDLVILEAEFELEPGDPEELTRRMQKQWIIKKASQPLGHQSAGCMFKNPPGQNAAQLIEGAGLKGARVGGAEVSDRHANFIIADNNATADDVKRLMALIRDRVRQQSGVELEDEVEVW